MSEHIGADEAQRLLDAATPGDPVLAERLAIVSEWLDAVRHPDMGADVASAASLLGGGE